MPEELIIRHCAPTLAGIKTANLFGCFFDTAETLHASVRALNHALNGKGLRVLPLRYANGRALIYIYRPNRLKQDLCDQEARQILERFGYQSEDPEQCVVQLMNRLREYAEFPHEIGLFLGYPPEDVTGFIENKARDCKCVGCWKVYGDVEKAQKTFALYKKCTDVYFKQWSKGKSIERLTVAG